VSELADGEHDALIINTSDVDADGVVRIEVAITSGEAKGSTVFIRGQHLRGDPLSMLGLPVRLVVVDGQPRLVFD
jgi:hypothetical protein